MLLLKYEKPTSWKPFKATISPLYIGSSKAFDTPNLNVSIEPYLPPFTEIPTPFANKNWANIINKTTLSFIHPLCLIRYRLYSKISYFFFINRF